MLAETGDRSQPIQDMCVCHSADQWSAVSAPPDLNQEIYPITLPRKERKHAASRDKWIRQVDTVAASVDSELI